MIVGDATAMGTHIAAHFVSLRRGNRLKVHRSRARNRSTLNLGEERYGPSVSACSCPDRDVVVEVDTCTATQADWLKWRAVGFDCAKRIVVYLGPAHATSLAIRGGV